MTNAYHRRREDRQLKERTLRATAASVRLLEIDHYARDYEQAFFDAYHIKTKVTYSHGWYYAHKRKVRQTQLTAMTSMLLAQVHEQELAL